MMLYVAMVLGGSKFVGPHAVVAAAEICEQFVADGAGLGRDFIDAQRAADQRDKAAAMDGALRNISHIHGEKVHGDAPDDRAADAANQYLPSGFACCRYG